MTSWCLVKYLYGLHVDGAQAPPGVPQDDGFGVRERMSVGMEEAGKDQIFMPSPSLGNNRREGEKGERVRA